MGLYYTLFYGCIIKTPDDDALIAELTAICKRYSWSLVVDGANHIIDFRADPKIDLHPLEAFHSDEKNSRRVVHGENKTEVIFIGDAAFNEALLDLTPFNPDTKWIRSEFYSGDMTTSYLY
jgi:hypothetical protein